MICFISTKKNSFFSIVKTFSECPSEQAKEDIVEDLVNTLYVKFGVSRDGLIRSHAVSSCEQALSIHPEGIGYHYWINNGNTTQQE